jgi:hypothetical protein
MSIAGIAGAVVCTILVLLIIRPVYSNMYEEVFLRIGGNRNVWGKLQCHYNFISLAVYKFYTLCKSFLELDLIITLVFMLTSIFIWYNIEQRQGDSDKTMNLYLLIPEVAVLLIGLVNNWHGHHLVSNLFALSCLG